MKILHLTAFYEPHLGGVETHLRALNQELLKRGHEVWVLTACHDANLPLQEKKDGIEIIRIETETKYYNKLNHKLIIWRQVAKQAQLLLNADIIHVHDVYWWLIPLLPLFWSKIYVTFHGWEGKYPVPWQYKLARFVWSKLAMKTIHVGDYIREFYWDQPNAVVYGGVRISKKIIPKQKIKKLQIVFVGRLELENDLKKYLILAKKLKKHRLVDITWVGDGDYKNDCQKYGTVTGMIKNTTSVLAKADLVWSASYLSILEAQALGKIVCAFYSHPLKQRYLEIYPGSKLMLIESNVERLSRQILGLLDNSKTLKKYSTHAYNWAMEQTWEKVADTYEKLWGIK
ncbi:glycosyltransferase family 4 protein [Patescibacteria group bacterium]|nr:glycosyltransferase family 4 protein [Patescibacteria group bacterium]MBU1967363.1 glycosyltransferase family 4 protein [Patescibacteria group bacterium]